MAGPRWSLVACRQLLEKLGAQKHRPAAVIGPVPRRTALVALRRTVGPARRPPAALARHMMLLYEIERVLKHFEIGRLSGEPVHLKHGNERFGLHPPFFFRVVGGGAERTGIEEPAVRAVVAVFQTVFAKRLGPAAKNVRRQPGGAGGIER